MVDLAATRPRHFKEDKDMADIRIESGFIQLYERKVGKAKWRPYVGVFELWKICKYRSERQARAHARLLKRKNPGKEYAVFVLSETRTIRRKFVDCKGVAI